MSATACPFDAVEARQERMPAGDDGSATAARIHPMAERQCEVAHLIPGTCVLDVATGSANAAIAAAHRDCDLVGVGYIAALLERARALGAPDARATDMHHRLRVRLAHAGRLTVVLAARVIDPAGGTRRTRTVVRAG